MDNNKNIFKLQKDVNTNNYNQNNNNLNNILIEKKNKIIDLENTLQEKIL